jgi:hypothetical protein
MNAITATGLAAFIGLCVGNFIWQAVTSRQWGVATERSYYQGIAVLLVCVAISAQGA